MTTFTSITNFLSDVALNRTRLTSLAMTDLISSGNQLLCAFGILLGVNDEEAAVIAARMLFVSITATGFGVLAASHLGFRRVSDSRAPQRRLGPMLRRKYTARANRLAESSPDKSETQEHSHQPQQQQQQQQQHSALLDQHLPLRRLRSRYSPKRFVIVVKQPNPNPTPDNSNIKHIARPNHYLFQSSPLLSDDTPPLNSSTASLSIQDGRVSPFSLPPAVSARTASALINGSTPTIPNPSYIKQSSPVNKVTTNSSAASLKNPILSIQDEKYQHQIRSHYQNHSHSHHNHRRSRSVQPEPSSASPPVTAVRSPSVQSFHALNISSGSFESTVASNEGSVAEVHGRRGNGSGSQSQFPNHALGMISAGSPRRKTHHHHHHQSHHNHPIPIPSYIQNPPPQHLQESMSTGTLRSPSCCSALSLTCSSNSSVGGGGGGGGIGGIGDCGSPGTSTAASPSFPLSPHAFLLSPGGEVGERENENGGRDGDGDGDNSKGIDVGDTVVVEESGFAAGVGVGGGSSLLSAAVRAGLQQQQQPLKSGGESARIGTIATLLRGGCGVGSIGSPGTESLGSISSVGAGSVSGIGIGIGMVMGGIGSLSGSGSGNMLIGGGDGLASGSENGSDGGGPHPLVRMGMEVVEEVTRLRQQLALSRAANKKLESTVKTITRHKEALLASVQGLKNSIRSERDARFIMETQLQDKLKQRELAIQLAYEEQLERMDRIKELEDLLEDRRYFGESSGSRRGNGGGNGGGSHGKKRRGSDAGKLHESCESPTGGGFWSIGGIRLDGEESHESDGASSDRDDLDIVFEDSRHDDGPEIVFEEESGDDGRHDDSDVNLDGDSDAEEDSDIEEEDDSEDDRNGAAVHVVVEEKEFTDDHTGSIDKARSSNVPDIPENDTLTVNPSPSNGLTKSSSTSLAVNLSRNTPFFNIAVDRLLQELVSEANVVTMVVDLDELAQKHVATAIEQIDVVVEALMRFLEIRVTWSKEMAGRFGVNGDLSGSSGSGSGSSGGGKMKGAIGAAGVSDGVIAEQCFAKYNKFLSMMIESPSDEINLLLSLERSCILPRYDDRLERKAPVSVSTSFQNVVERESKNKCFQRELDSMNDDAEDADDLELVEPSSVIEWFYGYTSLALLPETRGSIPEDNKIEDGGFEGREEPRDLVRDGCRIFVEWLQAAIAAQSDDEDDEDLEQDEGIADDADRAKDEESLVGANDDGYQDATHALECLDDGSNGDSKEDVDGHRNFGDGYRDDGHHYDGDDSDDYDDDDDVYPSVDENLGRRIVVDDEAGRVWTGAGKLLNGMIILPRDGLENAEMWMENSFGVDENSVPGVIVQDVDEEFDIAGGNVGSSYHVNAVKITPDSGESDSEILTPTPTPRQVPRFNKGYLSASESSEDDEPHRLFSPRCRDSLTFDVPPSNEGQSIRSSGSFKNPRSRSRSPSGPRSSSPNGVVEVVWRERRALSPSSPRLDMEVLDDSSGLARKRDGFIGGGGGGRSSLAPELVKKKRVTVSSEVTVLGSGCGVYEIWDGKNGLPDDDAGVVESADDDDEDYDEDDQLVIEDLKI
ncbi:hypothetical protein HDU76_002218 [Blyttiomyces sp. JEL0837]|nr:hypothetical protein HDU76_002218 [Blyttiomyces sp. JEL0837]